MDWWQRKEVSVFITIYRSFDMSQYENIISNLSPKFEQAHKSGDLFFFDSKVKDVEQNGRKVS